jgi:hypothetical protein
VSYQVVIWTNAGERTTLPCETMDEAKRLAKENRTLDKQDVKIFDAIGTVHHWSRIVGEKTNRWSVRDVVT